jgi:hypothetical protein
MRYLPRAREVGLLPSDERSFDAKAAAAKKPSKQPTAINGIPSRFV